MNILGICDSQDSGAVIVDTHTRDIAAVNEERLSRIKLSGGFPLLSIGEVLRLKGVNPVDIGMVVIASRMTPSFILRNLRKFHSNLRNKHRQFSILLVIYILYQVIAHKSRVLESIESFFSEFYFKRKLRKFGINCKVTVVDHHMAHAYGAYVTSGFSNALIMTIDGLGDGVSFTVNTGKEGRVKRIFEQSALNDITLYYSRLTEFLGFKPIQDEGKVMGLAGYSRDCSVLPAAKKLLRVEDGRFKAHNYLTSYFKDKKIYKSLMKADKIQVAASFQTLLEEQIIAVVKHWIKKTGMRNIVLSGGLFANIKVNQKLCELREVEEVYVNPHMGDGGLALGAAYSVIRPPAFRLKNVFFGPEYSNEYILALLKPRNLRYRFYENIEEKVALYVSRGKIIARFSGGMEYGPRALGNRSIICQATSAGVKNLLNKKLKRDAFMPFAPAILMEYRNDCCLNADKAAYSANFMNISFPCTDYFIKTCPAVVHEDGTTRPQFVSKDNNESFYKIVAEYRKLTGVPAVINTSFNIHEDPIVCSPEDALRTFMAAGLDYLAIGNFLVEKEGYEGYK